MPYSWVEEDELETAEPPAELASNSSVPPPADVLGGPLNGGFSPVIFARKFMPSQGRAITAAIPVTRGEELESINLNTPPSEGRGSWDPKEADDWFGRALGNCFCWSEI